MERLLLFLFNFLLGLGLTHSQDLIQLSHGKITGYASQDRQIRIYKGIPFAAAPVGELRWKAPQPPEKWTGIRECVKFGASPMQAKPVPFSMWSQEFLIPENPIDEDCLYLNVWTGAKDPQEKRPVVVWIYGGGFVSGGSGVPIYDGEAMARKGIIFVSLNYRVGIFGFFCHPELSGESPTGTSGNYGLLDQIAALQWVQENIAAFGGDPDNVTIAGQSAGAMSVNCLVASPLARGLFQRAIAHSGASFSGQQLTLNEAERAGLDLARNLEATSIRALRNITADSLLKIPAGVRGPIIDGHVLPEQIVRIFQQNNQNKVDLLTGWTEDEGLIFGPLKNAAEFKNQLKNQYPELSDELLIYYPATDDEIATRSQKDLARDMIFGAQNYRWANMQAESSETKVFLYRFTRDVPGTGIYTQNGAFHTGDIPYAYDNLRFVDRPWEETDWQLARIMSDYWANFIKSGDPNGENLPLWPEYQLNDKLILIAGNKVSSRELPDAEALDLITKIITR